MSDDNWTDALSSPGDPWSSQEVDKVLIRDRLQAEILRWIPTHTVRACNEACGYASDFEITEEMAKHFKEVYEGMIRRMMRILRKDGKAITVSKKTHRHYNTDTHHWVQCHRIPAIVIPLRDGDPDPEPAPREFGNPPWWGQGRVHVEDVPLPVQRRGDARRDRRP